MALQKNGAKRCLWNRFECVCALQRYYCLCFVEILLFLLCRDIIVCAHRCTCAQMGALAHTNRYDECMHRKAGLERPGRPCYPTLHPIRTLWMQKICTFFGGCTGVLNEFYMHMVRTRHTICTLGAYGGRSLYAGLCSRILCTRNRILIGYYPLLCLLCYKNSYFNAVTRTSSS